MANKSNSNSNHYSKEALIIDLAINLYSNLAFDAKSNNKKDAAMALKRAADFYEENERWIKNKFFKSEKDEEDKENDPYQTIVDAINRIKLIVPGPTSGI